MRRMRTASVVATGLLALLGSGREAKAQAEPFRVISVPWVATRPEVPHDGVNGQSSYFQAVGRGGNCGTYEYRWDFNGDGLWDTNGGNFTDAPSKWDLGVQYTYDNQAADRLFVARVEGRCGAETDTAEFPIRIRVNPTRAQRLNRAITNGLWYGHVAMSRDEANHLAWWGETPDMAVLAQAFMNRGHRHGVDPETDPYYEDANWIVNMLLTRYTTVDIQSGNVGGVNPDVNGNTFGLMTDRDNSNYFGGPQLEAIASWGDMDYICPPTSSANVAGRRLGDVVQDAAEFFMWAQTDIAFNDDFAGGWDYGTNSGAPDTSQVGWAAVGLFSAGVNGGATIPDWVKTRTYNVVAYNASERAGGPVGGYGYHGPNECGSNHSRSGAMLNALGFALSRNRDDVRVRNTIAFLGNNFDNDLNDCWTPRQFNGDQANYYALYQITKGMRSFGEPIRFMGDANVDWYARYADFLIRTQGADGRWTNDNGWMGAREMVHGMALLIAIPTIFETPPVAVADANPVLAGPGDLITFSHSQSYAPDPSVPIVAYRWDFVDYPTGLDLNSDGDFLDPGEHAPEDTNGDGQVTGDEIVWEVQTGDPNERPTFTYNPPGLSFGDEVVFKVTLEVEDALHRTSIDDESVHIRVSIINHPPVALPHPSGNPDATYAIVPGRSYLLDGGRSYDPDSDDLPQAGFPVDFITSYLWDLNGDGVFETSGVTANFDAPSAWQPGERHSVQFKVCDDGTWVGTPDATCPDGDCTLCSERSVSFDIIPNAPPVATADPSQVDVEEGGNIHVSAGGSDPEGGLITGQWSCDEFLTYDVDAQGNLSLTAAGIDAPAEGLTFYCTLTVTDDLGAMGSIDVPVHVANANPIIQIVDAPATANEGATVSLAIVATDPSAADADNLRYNVDCDGDGILDVLDSNSPVVDCSWPDEGLFVGTVEVDDDDGGVATQNFSIEVLNVAPSIDPIVCPAATEGTPIALPVRVTDPGILDHITCAMVAPIPGGSAINNCQILWTPTYAQAVRGLVDFNVAASDGDGGQGNGHFQCRPRWLDEDGDGLPDTWENQNGVQDPNGDPDGDGLTNADEFALGTDPHVFNGATPPVLQDPIGGIAVNTTTPFLTLRNAHDNNPRAQGLRYEFQLYADSSLRQPVEVSDLVPETPATTSHQVGAGLLLENHVYWWTARANNGFAYGTAPQAETFVVNAVNEAPSTPSILRPEDGDAVASTHPTLVVDNATDADPGDTELTLQCEIATDDQFADVVSRVAGAQSAEGSTALAVVDALAEHGQFFARCRARDAEGATSDWSAPVGFTIDSGNLPPDAPECRTPALDSIVRDLMGITLIAGNAADPENDPLTYRFELSPDPTFPNASTVTSDEQPGDPSGATAWHTDSLLQDNHVYFWRVRARDGRAAGPSCTSRFRVDLVNEPPSVPTPVNPWVDTVSEPSPRFVWAESTDPEGDPISYEVGLFNAPDQVEPIWTATAGEVHVDYEAAPLPSGDYWWHVRAQDNQEGHYSDWSALIHFVIDNTGTEADAVVLPDASEAKPDAETPDVAVLEPDASADLGVVPDAAPLEPDAAPPAIDAGGDATSGVEPDGSTTGTNSISQRVTGAGCSTASPAGRAPAGAAVGLLLCAAGIGLRRRRR